MATLQQVPEWLFPENALGYGWSMILSENRFPPGTSPERLLGLSEGKFFGIMR